MQAAEDVWSGHHEATRGHRALGLRARFGFGEVGHDAATDGESRNRRAAAAKPCRSATVANAVIA